MPLYTYKCSKCGHKQDISHLMGDQPTVFCPVCSIPLVKTMGVASVTFKGNGWGHQ